MQKRKVLEPYPMFGPGSEAFPASTEMPEGAIRVTWQDRTDVAMLDVKANVVYQSRSGEDQHLQIFMPMSMQTPGAPAAKYPLVVYIPGSAWHRQNLWMGLDRARYFASRGYVFAIVEYRPSDIAPFPAQIEDAMAAVQFLRAHAGDYAIDGGRIALWGDSSGGHTAVSAAFRSPELVKCVADWFGPMDIEAMNYYPSAMEHHSADSPEGFLLGKRDVLENKELAQRTNPLQYITEDTPLPPILIMHGSADNVVPFNQSVLLYEKLRACGKDATFYRLEGAGHGVAGFHSSECLHTTLDWIARHL